MCASPSAAGRPASWAGDRQVPASTNAAVATTADFVAPPAGRKVGVLALQGAFREHREVIDALGAHAIDVRTRGDLAGIDALVLPGGESTSMLLISAGLFDPVAGLVAEGVPVLATCAGLILLARHVAGGRPDQRSFGVL